ncbi:LPXTG cell wall anchor domain-containing protein [Macrococcus caseolyticus]|uniref:LPXTG cell wall anchor domain-containing protein n=1 Tax=Macrococcoides caseolyticum TaxID=69966 RepID=UPI0024BC8901|nr:LPXTG cell wall anchor domain-containing protein [Macrococcus caseolyticus]MDJ1091950.1 LPXTG cell wall anchor domain-containing protein [Macrococcus caseolyticus]MDJ1153940.1 LPXTG cell wall anchor domain-containing protein [Macrococcus caseolyticus]
MYKFKVKAVAALVCMLGLSTQNATLSEAADNSVTAEQPSSEQVESIKNESSLKSTEDKSPESPVIEIVSTEIIKEDETTEMPTTEAPTTEIPSKEQTPTTELPSVEVNQPTEHPTTEVPTTEHPITEHPTTEHPALAFPSHDDADSTPPKYDGNDYSAGVVPPSPGTIDIPELPDTPVSPVELSDSESEFSSLEEDDDLLSIKPGKFKPTDGEAYYAALDKQVWDLVTREIGKSKKSHQDKDSKATSKQKQKVKKHAKLPDTGENVFMYVLASVSLLLSGLILLRKS